MCRLVKLFGIFVLTTVPTVGVAPHRAFATGPADAPAAVETVSAKDAPAEVEPVAAGIEQEGSAGEPVLDFRRYNRGGIFGGGLGGGATVASGPGLGAYSAFARFGYWLTDWLSVNFQWHGFTGPEPGEKSYSLQTWGGRFDVVLHEITPKYQVYGILMPGLLEIGLQRPPPVGAIERREFAMAGGLGVTLDRFSYLSTSFEVYYQQVLTGPSKFGALGVYLTAWVRPDAGLVTSRGYEKNR